MRKFFCRAPKNGVAITVGAGNGDISGFLNNVVLDKEADGSTFCPHICKMIAFECHAGWAILCAIEVKDDF